MLPKLSLKIDKFVFSDLNISSTIPSPTRLETPKIFLYVGNLHFFFLYFLLVLKKKTLDEVLNLRGLGTIGMSYPLPSQIVDDSQPPPLKVDGELEYQVEEVLAARTTLMRFGGS